MAKSTRPVIRIHDLATDEVIDREMNDAEFAQYQTDQAAESARKTAAEAKVNARTVLLEKLGITADEAKLLLG